MALAETSSFNTTFTLRWLIQQCLSAQHMWLPVTPLCKPFEGSHVADDVASLVLINECCASVGRRVLIRARALQERMAVRSGVTLIEDFKFHERMKR